MDLSALFEEIFLQSFPPYGFCGAFYNLTTKRELSRRQKSLIPYVEKWYIWSSLLWLSLCVHWEDCEAILHWANGAHRWGWLQWTTQEIRALIPPTILSTWITLLTSASKAGESHSRGLCQSREICSNPYQPFCSSPYTHVTRPFFPTTQTHKLGRESPHPTIV